ncbi:hypothetical protein [Alkalihalophilus marmarensis]|uniref:hypothetical protein n=1 Tax=Alkalihalophilus marmarensis TaxID=521377 RepID=UPI002DBDAB1A|nr:hypothetical protein [Alkalihalophilus marmarensis]MEC2070343.1 hypothetical protein [Alkalihalophilus marmarensis]
MLKRYPSVSHFLEMPFQEAADIYFKAVEQEQDQKLWEMWLARYQHMDKDNFLSFEQFKINSKSQRSIKRSEEEVLEDADNILKSLKVKAPA